MRNFSVRTRVNTIEATYERSRVNVKVERGSTFTFTRDLPYIVSISFTRVRTEKLCDSGNPPLGPVRTSHFRCAKSNANEQGQ